MKRFSETTMALAIVALIGTASAGEGNATEQSHQTGNNTNRCREYVVKWSKVDQSIIGETGIVCLQPNGTWKLKSKKNQGESK